MKRRLLLPFFLPFNRKPRAPIGRTPTMSITISPIGAGLRSGQPQCRSGVIVCRELVTLWHIWKARVTCGAVFLERNPSPRTRLWVCG